MKNLKISILTLILGTTLITGCQNEKFYYQDLARVRIEAPYIWALGTDSLEYTFVTSPITTTEFDMPVTLWIMGGATTTDRVANLAVDPQKTTAQAGQYSVPVTVTIPANATKADFVVKMKRTTDLQAKGVRLYISVVESTDFQAGVVERDHLLLKWNDLLSKPTNWDSLIPYFGEFSLVKYRFMLNTTGVSNFSVETMSWAELMNYKIELQTALSQYNDAHPGDPLRDENGTYVTFS